MLVMSSVVLYSSCNGCTWRSYFMGLGCLSTELEGVITVLLEVSAASAGSK